MKYNYNKLQYHETVQCLISTPDQFQYVSIQKSPTTSICFSMRLFHCFKSSFIYDKCMLFVGPHHKHQVSQKLSFLSAFLEFQIHCCVFSLSYCVSNLYFCEKEQLLFNFQTNHFINICMSVVTINFQWIFSAFRRKYAFL